MSDITTIQATDIVASSRGVINQNFANLNATKLETSSAVAAVQSSFLARPPIASQLGTGTADTTTFLRGDLQWAAPGSAPVARTLIPEPVAVPANAAQFQNVGLDGANDTTVRVGQVTIPFAITVNRVSFICTSMIVAGRFAVTLYDEQGVSVLNGATSILSNDIGTTTLVSASLAAVVINPGVYYVGATPINSAAGTFSFWNADNTVGPMLLNTSVVGKPVINGVVTPAVGFLPPAIITSSITGSAADTVIAVRLDN